jgi:hypothetical protein
MDDSGQLHALAALPRGKNSRFILGDWVGPRHVLVILEKNIPETEQWAVQANV